MPQYVMTNGRLSLAENPNRVSLLGLVQSHNAHAQTLAGALTVGNAARSTAQAQFKQIGIEVLVDRGTGVMEQIPNNEIGHDLSIKEDLDAYSDVLTISLLGTKYAPWVNTLIRGQRQIQVFVSYGSPGNHYSALVFDGYMQSGSFKFTPPVTTVQCFDKAIRYAQDPVDYNLPVNSGKSRLEILFALLDQGAHGSVPVGAIDIGENGGTINKSFSTGPETRRFDLIRDAICGPTGTRLFFSAGRLNITKFNPQPAVDRILTRKDIAIPLQIDVPNTNDYNSVSVTAVNFASTNANNNRVETQIETVTKKYSRGSWVKGMTGGVIFPAPMSYVDPETEREVSRIVTTNTYQGSVLIYSQVDEYAWFSPLVAAHQLNVVLHGDPTVGNRTDVPIYQYADGSWHLDPMEQYRLVKRTITKKTFGIKGRQYYSSLGESIGSDGSGLTFQDFDHSIYVVNQTEERYFYHAIGQAPLIVINESGAEVVPGTASSIPVDSNGRGVLFGQESIGLLNPIFGNRMLSGLPALVGLLHPDSSTVTDWDLVIDPTGTNDGAIKSQSVIDMSYGPGTPLYQTEVGAYRYGLQDKTYYSLPFEVFDATETTRKITYTQIDDETYLISDAVDDGSGKGSVRTNSTGQGALPRAEALQPSTQSQQIMTKVSDAFRIMVNGEIPETLHNEYCENASETRTFALTTLRELSAWTVTIPMPLEGQIHKTSVLKLQGLPEIGAEGAILQVTQVQRDFAKFRQTVVAKYYPPEVANL